MSSAYHGNVCSSAFTQHHTTATLSANENMHTQHPRPTIDSSSQVPLRLDRIIHSPLLSRHRVRRNSTFLSPEHRRCPVNPHTGGWRDLLFPCWPFFNISPSHPLDKCCFRSTSCPRYENPPCSFLGQLTDASDRYLTRDRFAMCHSAGHPHFILHASTPNTSHSFVRMPVSRIVHSERAENLLTNCLSYLISCIYFQ